MRRGLKSARRGRHGSARQHRRCRRGRPIGRQRSRGRRRVRGRQRGRGRRRGHHRRRGRRAPRCRHRRHRRRDPRGNQGLRWRRQRRRGHRAGRHGSSPLPSPLPRVEADEVRAEFDKVAVLQGRGRFERLAVEPGAQPAAVVFQDVLSVALAGDAGVLGLQVASRVAQKRQRQMVAPPQHGDVLAENQFSAGPEAVDNGQPGFLQDELGQPDQGADGHAEDDEAGCPGGHVGAGGDGIEEQTAQQAAQGAAEAPLRHLRLDFS